MTERSANGDGPRRGDLPGPREPGCRDRPAGGAPADRDAADRLRLSPSPHIHAPDSTPRIMWTVSATLVPVVLASTWFFGVSALLVLAAAVLGAGLTEAVLGAGESLVDGSAILTGLLLGLTLPAAIPLWMAFLGGGFAIAFGKVVFGGLGQNVFNPALLGRAFLQAAFPTALTTWPVLSDRWTEVYASNLALPFLSPGEVDAVTAATPLGLMKFEAQGTELLRLAVGDTTGSLGETAGVLLLVGGGYLAARRYLDWRIPVAVFATVAAFTAVLHALDPSLPGPVFSLLSGGMMLGVLYMATDPVTSPVTPAGAWVFGIGIGVITVLIRVWGGLPEGIMYAILFMNALVPLIEKATQPDVFGGRAPAGGAP